jgi:hypothetical protein
LTVCVGDTGVGSEFSFEKGYQLTPPANVRYAIIAVITAAIAAIAMSQAAKINPS